MARRRILTSLAALATWTAIAAPALAWHGKGHYIATALAVEAAANQLPEFFAPGAATIAHCSLDPDMFTRPVAPAALHAAESEEHYFDIELLKGAQPPATRYEFHDLCAEKKIKPTEVGLLPYAITEWTQRLTVALAEHRAYPRNVHIRLKVLIYAGLLSHYSEDLCQPLHVTIHWDGRAKADGTSPRSGIHQKVDALFGKLTVDQPAILAKIKPAPFQAVLPAALAEIGRSHKLVEKVYDIEKLLPALSEKLKQDSPAGQFTIERLTAAAEFTASLYVTAWRDSEKIKLPDWYRRPYDSPDPPFKLTGGVSGAAEGSKSAGGDAASKLAR